jgi:hypothetical protein
LAHLETNKITLLAHPCSFGCDDWEWASTRVWTFPVASRKRMLEQIENVVVEFSTSSRCCCPICYWVSCNHPPTRLKGQNSTTFECDHAASNMTH